MEHLKTVKILVKHLFKIKFLYEDIKSYSGSTELST